MKNFWSNKYIQYLAVWLLFFVFTLINTYPLINHLTDYQIGDSARGGDGLMFMWDFWWVKTAIFDLFQNPYHTNYIFYPEGTDLYLHTLVPFSCLLAIPLNYVFNNLVLVYNLLVIFYFTLAGFATFLLAKHLIKNTQAAILAGYIFAFSPYMLGHALGHLNLLTSGFIPLFLLFYFKIFENPRRKYVLAAAFFLILCLVDSIYYGIFMLIFASVYAIYYFLVNGAKQTLKIKWSLLMLLTIFFVITGPLINKISIEQSSGQYQSNHELKYWSSDIMTFFIPGISNSALNFTGELRNKIVNNSHLGAENQNYVGYAVLALAIIGLIGSLRKKQAVFVFSPKYYAIIFSVIAVISSVFVLGSDLKAFGNEYNFQLPYYYVYSIFPFVSVPGRFMILVVLALAILAGWGFFYLQNLYLKRRTLFFSLVLILIMIEYIASPFLVSKIAVPDFYRLIANDPGDFAVWDLSRYIETNNKDSNLIKNAVFHMYYQTVHHKKIIDGSISRNNKQALLAAETGLAVSQLKSLVIKYVILPEANESVDDYKIIREQIKDFSIFYRDELVVVYQVY